MTRLLQGQHTSNSEERRQEVIDYLLETGLLERCVKYQTKGCKMQYWIEELRQEAWLWVLTYDADKLLDAYDNGHLNALLTAYLRNQFISSTSPFYKTYKKWDASTDEIDTGGDIEEKVDIAII